MLEISLKYIKMGQNTPEPRRPVPILAGFFPKKPGLTLKTAEKCIKIVEKPPVFYLFLTNGGLIWQS